MLSEPRVGYFGGPGQDDLSVSKLEHGHLDLQRLAGRSCLAGRPQGRLTNPSNLSHQKPRPCPQHGLAAPALESVLSSYHLPESHDTRMVSLFRLRGSAANDLSGPSVYGSKIRTEGRDIRDVLHELIPQLRGILKTGDLLYIRDHEHQRDTTRICLRCRQPPHIRRCSLEFRDQDARLPRSEPDESPLELEVVRPP